MPWSTSRPPSSARGYGQPHRDERTRRMQTTSPADLCGYCQRRLGPSYAIDHRGRKVALWHLPHNRERTGYLPGMWHAACNRREGAQAGRARQTASRLRW